MTYGFCLKSSRSVQESWTRCCFGERMDGCQVFGPLQEKEQEKGCLEHVPRPHEKNNWGKKKKAMLNQTCVVSKHQFPQLNLPPERPSLLSSAEVSRMCRGFSKETQQFQDATPYVLARNVSTALTVRLLNYLLEHF